MNYQSFDCRSQLITKLLMLLIIIDILQLTSALSKTLSLYNSSQKRELSVSYLFISKNVYFLNELRLNCKVL